MKQPVEDRYIGIREFGTDAEIFEEYIDFHNQINYDAFNENSELGTSELEQDLAEVLVYEFK